jgi:hypothetical protein
LESVLVKLAKQDTFLLNIANQAKQLVLLSKGQGAKHHRQVGRMGFVHYLAKMDSCTSAQKPFYALKQYSVAIRGHGCIQYDLLI